MASVTFGDKFVIPVTISGRLVRRIETIATHKGRPSRFAFTDHEGTLIARNSLERIQECIREHYADA